MAGNRDHIVRATAAGQQLRVFACSTGGLVEEARRIHDASPVATAALGRLLTAGSMMGCMMKGEQDVLTLQIECSGPIGTITVTADSMARVKGYVQHPDILLPLNAKGKLDVAGAVGSGFLNVIRDIGMREPYNGRTELVSGEIAEDLTYYYAASEQIPSSVGLGVLVGRDGHVRQAGGFIIQVMPETQERVIDRVEKKLSEMRPVTELLEEGMDPEGLIHYLMEGSDVDILDRIPTSYYCNCSRERVSRAVASIGREGLLEMIGSGEPVEVKCDFCGSCYTFDTKDLTDMLER